MKDAHYQAGIKRQRLNHFPEMDGLRGISLLLYLPFHANYEQFAGSFVLIDLFFVLSGFLITSLLLIEYNRTGDVSLKNFYIRRFLRLWPALYLMLLVVSPIALFLSLQAPDQNNAQQLRITYLKEVLVSITYVTNWVRAFDIFNPILLGHTWSLAIEEQFYLLWPPLLVYVLMYRKPRVAAGVLLVSIVAIWLNRANLAQNGASILRLYNSLDTRLDSILIGCLVAILYTQQPLSMRLKSRLDFICGALLIPSIAYIFWVIFNETWRTTDVYNFVMPLTNTAGGILVYNIVYNRNAAWFKQFLSLKPLVYVGKITYSVYLWHWPIYVFLMLYFDSNLAILLIGSAISFLVASASYKYVELPFLRLKKKY